MSFKTWNQSRTWLAVLAGGLIAVPAWGQPRQWVDDFSSVATYNSASLLAPCYGGPVTKYSLIEATTGDIFNQQLVSGGGSARFSNFSRNGGIPATDPGGRFELAFVGWLGLGVGCPSEPAPFTSSEPFTSPELCVYGGFCLDHDQLNLQTVGRDSWGVGPAPNFDLDGRAPWGAPGVDDDGNGTTDGEAVSGLIPDIVADAVLEHDWKGVDGGWGVAGVDDNGVNGIDDQGERGWPGSDDTDDQMGRWQMGVVVRTNLATSSTIGLNIDPGNTETQFSLNEIFNLAGLQFSLADEISAGFYNPLTTYSYTFCASGTIYGAMLWTGTDMANPNETVGPTINTNHNSPADSVMGFQASTFANGAVSFLKNVTFKGNKNFSGSFWVVSGPASTTDFVNGEFGYPSPSADLDNDRDVDASDFLTFSNCFNGSLNPPASICASTLADLDCDNDVDASDFLTFSNCFNGALNRPKGLCLSPDLTNPANIPPPPANDVCATAEAVIEGTFFGEITQESTKTQVCATSGGKESWYAYTPSCTGTATIDLCDLTGLTSPIIDDTRITIYNTCGGGEVGVCGVDNDACSTGKKEIITVSVTAGTPILIAVSGQSAADFGQYNLTISCP